MLSKGQKVMYGTNGVCSVEGTTVKHIAGSDIEYYVLKPLGAQTQTLFVPVKNLELIGKIRDIASADEVRQILDDLPDIGEWNDNKIDRTEAFRSTIVHGDCVQLVAMIRLIHRHAREQQENGKHLHLSDERILKEAEKMVSEEFSQALGVERDTIIPMLLK